MNISIPRQIFDGIFDECDRHDDAETGGRILGFYSGSKSTLHIEVRALIGPGPNARRTRTSLFQDGAYQERIFRAVEKQHPTIQHLGNWHSHHVNGLTVLSQGDCETYHKNVNSQNHNTDFFYSLLVIRKNHDPIRRYDVRHYMMFRGDTAVYEIHQKEIMIIEGVLQLAKGNR